MQEDSLVWGSSYVITSHTEVHKVCGLRQLLTGRFRWRNEVLNYLAYRWLWSTSTCLSASVSSILMYSFCQVPL